MRGTPLRTFRFSTTICYERDGDNGLRKHFLQVSGTAIPPVKEMRKGHPDTWEAAQGAEIEPDNIFVVLGEQTLRRISGHTLDWEHISDLIWKNIASE